MSATELLTKTRDSFVAGVSVRGTVALAVTATVCAATLLHIELTEPLRSIALFVFGYYFLKHEQK